MIFAYEKKIINAHLNELKIKKEDKIVLYSNLLSFGIYNENLPTFLLNAILKKITKKGTLIMQAYNFEKDKNYIFDSKKLNFNYSSNYLTNIFFKKKGIIRSACPIHNHIGLGKKASLLLLSNPSNSFGLNSDFDYLIKNNFDCIFLGCDPNQAGTFFLHLEQIMNVRHRKFVKLIKKVYSQKKIIKIKMNYFTKKKNIKYNLNKALSILIKNGLQVKKIPLEYGVSYRFNLSKFSKIGIKVLKKNDKSFILN